MRNARQQSLVQHCREARESRNAVTTDFVRTEVDLAETFCAIAANTSSPQRAERSREHALRALGGAARALTQVSMDERERATILRRIARIAKILHNSNPEGVSAEHVYAPER
jgi:hypothetical protein